MAIRQAATFTRAMVGDGASLSFAVDITKSAALAGFLPEHPASVLGVTIGGGGWPGSSITGVALSLGTVTVTLDVAPAAGAFAGLTYNLLF